MLGLLIEDRLSYRLLTVVGITCTATVFLKSTIYTKDS